MVDWAHLKAELVWVYEADILPPYDNMRDHKPGQSALLLLHGKVRVETEFAVTEACAGQWIFPRQGPRLQIFTENPRVLSVHFNLYWPGGQPLYQAESALVVEAAEAPELEAQARLLKHEVESKLPGVGGNLSWERGTLLTHFQFQRSFDSWLCEYVSIMERAGIVPSRLGQVDERILHAVNLLDEWPLAQTFDERRLAAGVGLSTSQLYRLFLRQFSQTPKRYLEERRLNSARQLLSGSPLSIKEISFLSGFQSLPAFSRWFHQHTGKSPRNYRSTSLTEGMEIAAMAKRPT